MRRHPIAIACLLTLLLPAAAAAASFETNVPPQKGEKYKSADFRIWIPDDVPRLRGVIVRQHGCGRNGIDHADDVQWRALAAKWDCALLGTHFQQDKECADWSNPANGSERALLQALQDFAERSKHPELNDAPWAFWGHSGGSVWSMHLLNRRPQRVIAVVGRSAAITEFEPAAYRVPVLFLYGEEEKSGRFENVHRRSLVAFAVGRRKAAPWTLAVDPKSGHDCRNSRSLAIRYLDAMLALRLPAAGQPIQALRPVAERDGWLGNSALPELAPHDRYAFRIDQASWLPHEAFGKAWLEFLGTGDIADHTPPPPPTNIRVSRLSEGIEITWDAPADLESGLKYFHLYRDGQKIATIGGATTKANVAGHYQVWNYGDEPEPRPAPLRYVDAKGAATSKYEVTSENHAGLQSVRK
jgi:pimeloyl-ACP methyl ester carboxylesterase